MAPFRVLYSVFFTPYDVYMLSSLIYNNFINIFYVIICRGASN